MAGQIKFEDWAKLEMRVGEVKKAGKKTIISCFGRDFEVNPSLMFKKGDKIIVGFLNDSVVIPLIQDKISIIPEKDIEAGSRIG